MLPPPNAVWEALTGPHAHLAERNERAARYQRDVAPFAALASDHGRPPGPDARAWADLAELVGPGGTAPLAGVANPPPEGWRIVTYASGVQFVGTSVEGRPDPEAEPLGLDDLPDMLDLIARTRPGPFLPRTIEMGRYLGIRRNGALVAMAGERVRVPGWAEISAVCTDATHRGAGLATRLVLAVVAGMRHRDELPFLHVVTANGPAIRLYESLGFTRSRRLDFIVVTPPGAQAVPNVAAGAAVNRTGVRPPRTPTDPPGR
jgi:ribosomal protein S18 acetylase RimI-like enzyme